jgi:hypothetical protein
VDIRPFLLLVALYLVMFFCNGGSMAVYSAMRNKLHSNDINSLFNIRAPFRVWSLFIGLAISAVFSLSPSKPVMFVLAAFAPLIFLGFYDMWKTEKIGRDLFDAQNH